MLRTIVLFAAFLSFSNIIVFAQGNAAAGDNIEWNEFYKLTWEDFQGSPGADAAGDAGTAVHIQAKPYYVKDQVMYDVHAYFNRKKSWSRERSEQLLAHEQLHFDIAELYARKIRKKVNDLREKGINDVKIYNAAIHQILEESNDADQRYDLETLHGALLKRQSSWQKEVQTDLQAMKDYKKPRRVITVGKTLKKQPLFFARR